MAVCRHGGGIEFQPCSVKDQLNGHIGGSAAPQDAPMTPFFGAFLAFRRG
jgi:hypothetical protein